MVAGKKGPAPKGAGAKSGGKAGQSGKAKGSKAGGAAEGGDQSIIFRSHIRTIIKPMGRK